MRCLTLAEELRRRGAYVCFVCRELDGHLCDIVESKGYRVHRLPNPQDKAELCWSRHAEWLEVPLMRDADETRAALSAEAQIDWLIVDHYAIERTWENALRPTVSKIFVIDDLADRAHDCDLLLDQNLYLGFEERYNQLVPERCVTFLGPRHVLLREEFHHAKQRVRRRSCAFERVLIFFGGMDMTDLTSRTLEALCADPQDDFHVDVVVGKTNPHRHQVEQRCATLSQCHFHCQVDNMAELMLAADLAIGAGGTVSWERIYLELPTIAIASAFNQVEGLKVMHAHGELFYLGEDAEITPEALRAALSDYRKGYVDMQFSPVADKNEELFAFLMRG